MKKTNSNICLLMTNVDCSKLLPTIRIVTLVLICGLTLPAYSLALGSPVSYDQQQLRVTGTITDAATGQAMPGEQHAGQVRNPGVGDHQRDTQRAAEQRVGQRDEVQPGAVRRTAQFFEHGVLLLKGPGRPGPGWPRCSASP